MTICVSLGRQVELLEIFSYMKILELCVVEANCVLVLGLREAVKMCHGTDLGLKASIIVSFSLYESSLTRANSSNAFVLCCM